MNPELLYVSRIWNQAPHNALTDLIRYKDKWFCVFREGEEHVGGKDGQIRIISSTDGISWSSVRLFEEKGVDLRDPKLSITSEGKLMLLVGGTESDVEGSYVSWQSQVAFSEDGYGWSSFTRIVEPHEWLWRVTWYQGRAYGVSYRFSNPNDRKKEWHVKLFTSVNGIDYSLITQWDIPGNPNETTLRFLETGEMVALVRRDKKFDKNAWMGVSAPPYVDWKWKPLSHHFGGPNFLVLPDGEMWAAGRIVERNPYGFFEKMTIAQLEEGELTPRLFLPSGGDSTYPGMVYHEGFLWLSYYSSHQGKASIYFAKVLISDINSKF